VPPAVASWGSSAWVRHVVCPWQGASIVDCHDRVFSGKGRRVTLIGGIVGLHDSGEGPRCHENFHHVIVSELLLNKISVVWASLLKELLKVVRGRPHLMLVAACGSHGASRGGAARLLGVADVVTDRGCGLLETLLEPFPTALGVLPGIPDGDIR
jgi:hypothetical protein